MNIFCQILPFIKAVEGSNYVGANPKPKRITSISERSSSFYSANSSYVKNFMIQANLHAFFNQITPFFNHAQISKN